MILYHGSPIEIDDVALAAGTWLSDSLETAKCYGEVVYKIELPEECAGAVNGPNWEGHFVTRCAIPWRYIEAIGGADERRTGN